MYVLNFKKNLKFNPNTIGEIKNVSFAHFQVLLLGD